MVQHFSDSAKQIVAVALTPQLGLEVALLDKKSPTIVKYGRTDIEYNIATREIDDYDKLESSIVNLFKKLDINLKSNIYLVLPNVHLAFENVQLMLTDEGVQTVLLSKAEELYFFKKSEPKSVWADLVVNNQTDKRLLVYTSIQSTVIQQVQEIFQRLGSTLVGLESSYPAIIRGLSFAGFTEKEEIENSDWNLLLVNTNSYALFNMQGTKLVDFTEVPLAIKSFSKEEVYQAISTSVSQILPNFPAKKLIILSQSEDVCASFLRSEIIFDYDIVVHDCNKFSEVTNMPFSIGSNVSEDEAKEMSFSLIGALSVGHMSDQHLQLNFIKGEVIGNDVYFTFQYNGETIHVTQELLRKGLGILILALIILFALIYGLGVAINKSINNQTTKLKESSTTLQQEISAMSSKDGVVDIETLVEKIIEQNKKAINFYDAISTDIPGNVWLQYYYNKNGENLSIEGVSTNIGDIYNYYKSLKIISPNSSIKLNKLQILTQEDSEDMDLAAPDFGDKFYNFEISNVESPKARAEKTPLDSLGDQQQDQQSGTKRKATKRGSADDDIVPPNLNPPSVNDLAPVDIKN